MNGSEIGTKVAQVSSSFGYCGSRSSGSTCGGLTFECQVHIHTKLGSCTAAEKANLGTVHREKRGKFQMFLDPVSAHVRTILSEVRSAIAVTRSETPDLISPRSL